MNTLSSSLVLSLDQTLLHFSSRFDCILSFNFSLNLCNITPVLSLEQRWPSGSVILMTSTSPFASRVEMLKGHLNHLQSAHLHFTSSGHSFCLWQIWIPFTVSHFVPSWVESTSSTWTPLRSGIRSSSVASSSSTSGPPCTSSTPSSSRSIIWSSRAAIIWWTGSPIVCFKSEAGCKLICKGFYQKNVIEIVLHSPQTVHFHFSICTLRKNIWRANDTN